MKTSILIDCSSASFGAGRRVLQEAQVDVDRAPLRVHAADGVFDERHQQRAGGVAATHLQHLAGGELEQAA